MSHRRTLQGDCPYPPPSNLQYFDVSSSSDVYNSPYRSKYVISGRPSYRRPYTRFLRNSYTFQNSHKFFGRKIYGRKESFSTRIALFSLLLIFSSALLALYTIISTFPAVTEEEWVHIKLPWNIEDAKNLGVVLNRYKVDHYFQVMSGLCITYVFLQTFAIPGSLFLSILSGFLFPFTTALVLVCSCSAIGASLCFMLSQLLGRKLVLKYFPERARKWGEQVEKHKENMFNYILFLRITPFLPNWFINLTAPVIGVPLWPFAMGTFFGVAPPSFVAIQGGQTLQNLTADDFKIGTGSIMWLVVCGVVPLLPVFFKGWLKKKID